VRAGAAVFEAEQRGDLRALAVGAALQRDAIGSPMPESKKVIVSTLLALRVARASIMPLIDPHPSICCGL
jgi:hypothetical protein